MKAEFVIIKHRAGKGRQLENIEPYNRDDAIQICDMLQAIEDRHQLGFAYDKRVKTSYQVFELVPVKINEEII